MPTETPDMSNPAHALTRAANARPQKCGEAATTRFGMADGDNTATPATDGDLLRLARRDKQPTGTAFFTACGR
jgi:hypothetical protein